MINVKLYSENDNPSLHTNKAVKFKNQLLPNNFKVFFTSVKETHNYNTRLSSRMTYALPKTRTNYGIFNIRYQGAKIWNAISDNIKLLSLKQFKKKFKSSIMASY